MNGSTHLATWVSAETKQRFIAVASRHGLSESALLKRLIEQMFLTAGVADVLTAVEKGRKARGSRLMLRLQPDDRLLLGERAAARGTPAATYVSVLVRAHLRDLTPLSTNDLGALRRSVAELSAIGRNVNQIARAAHQSGRVVGPTREDLRTILKVCEGLRDHVMGLIRANAKSWETGHAETRP